MAGAAGLGVTTGLATTTTAPDRVWSLKELDILQDLTKPIAVVVTGAYEDPHCEGGMRYMSRVLMCNAECLRRFGNPRSQVAYSSILTSFSEDVRRARRTWLMKIYQEWNFQQSLLDLHELLRPIFSSVPDGPCLAKVDSKPIRVQTSASMVDTAVIHVMEGTADTSQLRVSAMHEVNPLHMFMFSSRGRTLNMNQAAMEACRYSGLMVSGPQDITMKALFEAGDYPGGEEEAEAAYAEAFHAIFHLQLERHRHTQPYTSKKDGRSKWAMIEMSPITDPVDGTPAVLVQRYNITQQKQLELQLSLQQEALQRHNQELEQDALATEQEKAKLQKEADSLAEQLEAVLHDKFATSGTSFDADTPIDKTRKFLQSIIMGGLPKVQAAMELYNILSESNTDLRQPVGLEEQLLKDEALDSEVGQSMLQLLQGNTPTGKGRRSFDQGNRPLGPAASGPAPAHPSSPLSRSSVAQDAVPLPLPSDGNQTPAPSLPSAGMAANPQDAAQSPGTSTSSREASGATQDIYAASHAAISRASHLAVGKAPKGIGSLAIKIPPPSPLAADVHKPSAADATSAAAPASASAAASASVPAAASPSAPASTAASAAGSVRPSEDGTEKSAASSSSRGAGGVAAPPGSSSLAAGVTGGPGMSALFCVLESVPPAVTPEIERRLKDAENSWAFDIFGFADATPGYSLSLLFCHLVKRTGLSEKLFIDEIRLNKFARRIERGYDATNPYHNSIHVASVVQTTHMLMCYGGVMKSQAFSLRQQIATYFSALVHDFEHGGVNNDFLIKTLHPLAVTYNDQSPLENHHHAAAVRLLLQPEYRYLPATSPARFAESMSEIRFMCISQVLGTDMKKHFDISSRFQAAFKRPAGTDTSGCTSSTGPQCERDWDLIKAEDKTLVHQMILKCADIGHLAASPRTHRRWAFQLEEEFFRQGDQERVAGLAVSPLMDRTQQGGMTRSQLGFFSIVGIPLFKAMVDLFEDARPMLDGVLANYHHWENNTELADLPA